jgi:hypothetical protein
MADPRPVQVEPYFGGFVLETLTIGMYGESQNAIREYIQNGFDSIQRAIHELEIIDASEGLIRVIFDDDMNGLRIRDNGAGLPVSIAVSTLTSVGASRKDYTTEAGFRGIGRLAGIVFCNTLTFTTKAQGEAEATEVIFDAEKMRDLMSPEKGSAIAAADLLSQCVTASVIDARPEDPPYFEVSMRDLWEPPEPLTSASAMTTFLSQVAPVRYADTFPYKAQIEAHPHTAIVPIDTVEIDVEEPGVEAVRVRKPYGDRYEVQDAPERVKLTEIQFYRSPKKLWWGWAAKKDVPGSYEEGEVRGIRVRAKNIQIDGTDVVRDIFQRHLTKSSGRYQDWIVGEIFVDLKSVVPNARRDGFEDTPTWKKMREEIAGSICKDAGSWAQDVSNKGQYTLGKLTEKSEKLETSFEALRRSDFRNQDRAINFSAEVTKLQGDIAKATRNADTPALAELQHLGSRLADIKSVAVAKIAGTVAAMDTEAVEAEARERLLSELMTLFEDHLEAPCLSAVRNLLKQEYDWPSL